MSFLDAYRFVLSLAAIALSGAADGNPTAPGPVAAPIAEVSIDADAYRTALELSECMREFKAAHREERRNPEAAKRLDDEEKTLCKLPENQQAIMARLRIANPAMGDAGLQKEYQKTVIIAMLDAFKKSLQAEKAVNAPNR